MSDRPRNWGGRDYLFRDTGTSSLTGNTYSLPTSNPFRVPENIPGINRNQFHIPPGSTPNLNRTPFRVPSVPGITGRTAVPGSEYLVTDEILRNQELINQRLAEMERARQMDPMLGVEVGSNIFENAWQTQYDRYLAEIRAQEDMLKASYSPTIEGMQDDIADLQRAAAALGMPFDEYLAAREQLGAGVDAADPLDETRVREEVIPKIYDDAEGELRATLEMVDMKLGEDMAAQITEQVREFEHVIDDVLRTDLESIDKLHTRSSEYAQALAQAAYSNDVYAAAAARTKIQAQIDHAIRERKEDLERQKKAQADSLKAIRSKMFQFEEPDYQTVLDGSIDKWLADNGIPQHERAIARDMFDTIMSDSRFNQNASTFRKGVTFLFNEQLLADMGVTPEVLAGAFEALPPDQAAAAQQRLLLVMTTRDLHAATQVSVHTTPAKDWIDVLTTIGLDGASIVGSVHNDWDNLEGGQGQTGSLLKDIFDIKVDLDNNWDQIVKSQGPAISESNVYSAGGDYHFPVVGGARNVGTFGVKRTKKQIADGKSPVHNGVDLAAPRGTPSVAPVSGTVVSMGYGNVSGYYIKIRDARGYTHFMGHMDSLPSNLQKGSTVVGGKTYIGGVGNTGNARNTTPHIHYEVKDPNGRYVDPGPQLNATGGWWSK